MAFKEHTPEEWIEQIDAGLEYRRKFGLEDLWGQFEAIYYNVAESMLTDGPNIFLSQGDAMLSMLTVPTPRVSVRPVKPEEVDKAPFVQTLDNILLREMGLAEEVETMALHTFLFGRGFIKIGYDSEWGYDPKLDMGGSLQLGLTLSQLDDQGSRRIEYDSSIAPGSPWARAVLPHDIVVPWGVRDISSTPWIAHRVVRHIDDLQADPKYSRTRDLEPQISMEDFVESYRRVQTNRVRAKNSREPEYVEMWEIHDRRTAKIIVVTRDHGKFLRKDQNALQVDNVLPFSSVSFTPRVRSFWTTPDAFYLFHIQNEISDVARQRTAQRRISTLKFLYDDGAISETELEKILSPDVGVAAKIEAGRKLQEAVIKLDNAPNPILANEEELLRANAREQIGFSRNQLGEYTGGRKTAREVSTVESSSRLRMTRRGLQIKRAYEEIFRITNNIVFQHWSIPRYISVVGESQTAKWLRVNGPTLRGRYDYEVSFVEQAEIEQMKLEALNLYQLLSQDPSIDPVELRNFLINRVNDPQFERLFNANVRAQVQQLQSDPRGVQGQGNRGNGSSQRGILSLLQQRNGAGSQSNPSRLLA